MSKQLKNFLRVDVRDMEKSLKKLLLGLHINYWIPKIVIMKT